MSSNAEKKRKRIADRHSDRIKAFADVIRLTPPPEFGKAYWLDERSLIGLYDEDSSVCRWHKVDVDENGKLAFIEISTTVADPSIANALEMEAFQRAEAEKAGPA